MGIQVKIEVSARHIHLTKEDVDELFGVGYELTQERALSQIGQYASGETVDVVSGEIRFDKIRVVGPVRDVTYVEMAKTDLYKLKMEVPILAEPSKDDNNQAGNNIKIIGPKGFVENRLVIIKQRHIHCDINTANRYQWRNRDHVSVMVPGVRSVTFHNVCVRVSDKAVFRFHLDTDEANAAGVSGEDIGYVLQKEGVE